MDLPSSRAALLASVNEVASLNAWEAFQVFAMLVAAMQRFVTFVRKYRKRKRTTWRHMWRDVG